MLDECDLAVHGARCVAVAVGLWRFGGHPPIGSLGNISAFFR